MSARSVARHLALSGLAFWYRAAGRMSSLDQDHIQFLYLHHMFPDEEAPFRRLLTALSRTHHLIGYSEAVDRILNGRIDKPYLCLSVDDGLKNSLRAARIMKEFGVSGCFFICPAMVGETNHQRLEEYCRQRFGMPPTELMSWNDIGTILKDGHEIGSHTMTHPVLSRISEHQAQDEIARSYEWLVAKAGRVDHFAWPEGRFFHFTPAAAEMVFDAGFKSCASAERGCHVARPAGAERSLCIRRDYISAKWPLSHVLYFIVRNCLTASDHNNQWPEGWFESQSRT